MAPAEVGAPPRTPPRMTIAFLGLGAMGARQAGRLLDAGHALAVWNRTPERAGPLVARGARLAASPRDAAQGADLAVAMVRDDDASRAVWTGADGALAGLAAGAVAVESSTLTPAWTRELGALAAAAEVGFVEAPVVGSRPHAEKGVLTVLAGGDAGALERARPALDAYAGAVHATGVVGTAAAVKLAVNALFAVQAAALAELLPTVAAAGVEPARAAELLNAMPTASPAAQRVASLMPERAFAPNFPIELVAKDLGYVVGAARAAGVGAGVVAAAAEAFAEAEARGFGGDDLIGIAQLHAPGGV